jgi:hypothetical protein
MKQQKKTNRATKQKAKRETLEERVHRHLTDINSEITDDDIRSVKTELEVRSDTNPENVEKKKNEIAPNTKNNQTTPWSGLSEGYD